MATIQIRDVPDEVHATYRRRAALAGMSLQEYLRAELVEGARRRSPAEVVAEVEAAMTADPDGWARRSSAADVRADRASH